MLISLVYHSSKPDDLVFPCISMPTWMFFFFILTQEENLKICDKSFALKSFWTLTGLMSQILQMMMPYFPRKHTNTLKLYYSIQYYLEDTLSRNIVGFLWWVGIENIEIFPAVNAEFIFRSPLTGVGRTVSGRSYWNQDSRKRLLKS